jgi:hypothetical protein
MGARKKCLVNDAITLRQCQEFLSLALCRLGVQGDVKSDLLETAGGHPSDA